jgi:hypothetical protein
MYCYKFLEVVYDKITFKNTSFAFVKKNTIFVSENI